MALIHCDFFSNVLGLSSSMYVILPQSGHNVTGKNKKYPVLYLLHGLSDDHSMWLRKTSIERYVDSMELAVVMPAVHRSFYTDMASGYKYWSFISEELPEIAQSLFPLSSKREDTFAAGLSMGGYGAMKLALRCPDKFAAAASLSGAVYILNHKDEMEENQEFINIFGGYDKMEGSENDLRFLADKLACSHELKPKLFQCCGTEDFLYQDNLKFRDYCKKLSLDLTYEEEPGVHEWGYWDKKIQRVLEWLPLTKNI